MTPNAKENRQKIVAEIIKDFEAGKAFFWDKKYVSLGSRFHNPITNTYYSGINNLILSYASSKAKYQDMRWCTFKQAKTKDWRIKKGEKGTTIEFWKKDMDPKKIERYITNIEKIKSLTEEEKEQIRKNGLPIIRNYVVFNAEQIEGIPPLEPVSFNHEEVTEKMENMIRNSEATIFTDQTDSNYYNLLTDSIHLVPSKQYEKIDDYYAVAAHEIAHSTGHESRLNRFMLHDEENYAKEELRAEIASLFITQEYGIGLNEDHLNNHKAYLQSWIKVLNNDYNELYRAASDAEKILTYVKEKIIEKPQIQPQMFVKNYMKDIISENQVNDMDTAANIIASTRMITIATGICDYFENFPEQAEQFNTKEKLDELISLTGKEYFHSEPDCPIATNIEFAIDKIHKSEKEATKMEEVTKNDVVKKEVKQEYQRKTKTISGIEDCHYEGTSRFNSVATGWIKGDVKTYDIKDGTRIQFNLANKAPDKDGKFPEKTFIHLVELDVKETPNLTEYSNGKKQIIVTGERDIISKRSAETGKAVSGREHLRFYARSAFEATINDEGFTKAGNVISPKENSLNNIMERAGREHISGHFVNARNTVFNREIKDKEGQTIGYRHNFTLIYTPMINGKPKMTETGERASEFINVTRRTDKPLTEQQITDIKTSKRLSVNIVEHMYDKTNANGEKQYNVKCCEAINVAAYLKRDVEKSPLPEDAYVGVVEDITEEGFNTHRENSSLIIHHKWDSLAPGDIAKIEEGKTASIKYDKELKVSSLKVQEKTVEKGNAIGD